MYQKELLTVGGTKFLAVNSKSNTCKAEVLAKKLRRIDENIAEYLSQIDKNDEAEPDPVLPEQIKTAIQDVCGF